MTIPQIVSYAENGACETTTSITIPAPSGIQENELLYGTIFAKFGFDSNGPLVMPSGWSYVFSRIAGVEQTFTTFYKIADSSDVVSTGYEFTSIRFGSARESFRGYIYRISGNDTINPFLNSGIIENISSISETYNNNLSLPIGDTLLIATQNIRNNFVNSVNSNGWTLLTTHACTVGAQHNQYTFYKSFDNACISNSPYLFVNPYNWCSTVVAIKPKIQPAKWRFRKNITINKGSILR